MKRISRRNFIEKSSMAMAGTALASARTGFGQVIGDRPVRGAEAIRVVNPLNRVPVSLIIDDSTCLVNLAHFCIPQFHEVFPRGYPQDWKKLPREIPDSFVRKFADWSAERGVRGKYSLIPHPACVGWLDRDMPGWSRQELEASLALVRSSVMPNWDIHPEMVSHTWVVDPKTGKPHQERTEHFMENWRWTDGKSVDEIANYMSYALRVLKNVGINCEGITTPGGFGNRALPELAQATLQSCRDVFKAEIPHYFRHLFTDKQSVAPRVEYASGLDGADPRCVVSMIGCTGDWFGGWDGLTPGSVDQFITEDSKGGRMPEVISSGEPAIMVCHWPGIYFNGQEVGFDILKKVEERLRFGFDNLIWMKLSEISRYWAAKELTSMEFAAGRASFKAPFATDRFTVEIEGTPGKQPRLSKQGKVSLLSMVDSWKFLRSGTWARQGSKSLFCFNLPKGDSTLEWV